MNDKQEFTIGNSIENTYRIADSSVGDTRLLITSLSASEYLLRHLSGTEDNLVVDRQRVIMSRIDKYTPLQLGKVSFTLDDLMKQRLVASSSQNQQTHAKVNYQIDTHRIYLAGASDICDICLPSPRVPWHAVEIQRQEKHWVVQQVLRKKSVVFQNDSTLRVGPYQVDFGEHGQLSTQLATQDSLIIKNIDVLHPQKKTPLIRAFSLTVKAGEFMGIIGPSGAGKSTLLKAIRAIIPITSGQILLSEQDTRQSPDVLKDIGFVPQDDIVIPELTVAENLRFATILRLPSDWPALAIERKVNELLTAMRLEEQQNNYCSQISGGQRKRVNLALEMMLEPTFLLADEVCSGLSSLDTDNILQHLRRIADSGKGILLTIHSPDIEAFDLMDTLLVLDRGGFIAYYGPAQPDAIQYFSKQKYSPYKSPKLIFDILEKTEGGQRKTAPEDWHQIYKSSIYYQEFIRARLPPGEKL